MNPVKFHHMTSWRSHKLKTKLHQASISAVVFPDQIAALLQLIRDVIEKHTGVTPPELPKAPVVEKYGRVALNESAVLLEQLSTLFPGDGIATDYPDIMEEYGQS